MSQTFRFWKPYDVLTKFTDSEGRPTLADYVPVPNIYAAGRLDKDSEGLLILTDDGALNTRLTHPRHHLPRTYWAQVEHIPDDETLQALAAGVLIKGERTRPAKVRLLPNEPAIPPRPVPIRERKHIPTAWVELVLTEGRNRQVRRMTAAVGHPTLRLVRWAVGDVTLAGLRPGAYLPLSPRQIERLRAEPADKKPRKSPRK